MVTMVMIVLGITFTLVVIHLCTVHGGAALFAKGSQEQTGGTAQLCTRPSHGTSATLHTCRSQVVSCAQVFRGEVPDDSRPTRGVGDAKPRVQGVYS